MRGRFEFWSAAPCRLRRRENTLAQAGRRFDDRDTPRAGAYLVSDLPEGLIAIHCPTCGRVDRIGDEASA
jgi:hypothetical protein